MASSPENHPLLSRSTRTSSAGVLGVAAGVAGITRIAHQVRVALADKIEENLDAISAEFSSLILRMSGTSYNANSTSFRSIPNLAEPPSTKPVLSRNVSDFDQISGKMPSASDSVRRNNIILLRTYIRYLRTGKSKRMRHFIRQLAEFRTKQGVGGAEIVAAFFHFRTAVFATLGSLTHVEQTACDLVTQQAVTLLASAVAAVKAESTQLAEKCYPPAEIFMMRREDGTPRLRLKGTCVELWRCEPGTDNRITPCPLIGALVNDRYLIQKHIAGGSFKHGWLAEDLRKTNDGTHRKVILFTLRAKHDGGCNEKELEHEMDVSRMLVAKGLDHPNLASVLDITPKYAPAPIQLTSGIGARVHYTVNDYCEGGELHGFISKGLESLWPKKEGDVGVVNFSEPAARSMFQQLIQALDFLHSRGYFHRDIKVDNVLVGKTDAGTWCLKLGDFGRMVEQERLPDSNENDQSNSDSMNVDDDKNYRPINMMEQRFRSNPTYCAPEMQRGLLYDGGPADIWQMAIILLHLVFISHMQAWQGMAWRTAENPFQVLEELVEQNLVKRHPKYFRSVRNLLSKDLVDLLSRMLAKDPRKRPTTAEVMRHPWLSSGEVAPDVVVSSELELRKPTGARLTHRIALPKIKTQKDAVALLKRLLDERKQLHDLQWEAHEERAVFTVFYSKIAMNLTVVKSSERYELHLSDESCSFLLEMHWTGGTDSSAWMRFIVDLSARVKEAGALNNSGKRQRIS
eukprot:g4093.t1